MRISTDQLPARLKRGLGALYAVFGDEPLLALEAADSIRRKAREDGYLEREVLVAEAHFDWSRLKASGVSQSLFATRRLLELRLPGGKPGVEGGQALQAFCERLPKDTVTLVELPAIDRKTQKGAWFAALESAGMAVEARPVGISDLPSWIAERLRAQGQHADADTLTFIAGKVEGNLLAAFQEIQKLALLFGPGELAFESVKEAILDVARFDVFDLGPILLSGDAVRFARALDALKGEGAAPPLVLWAITEELRALARVVNAVQSGRPVPLALREAGVWGPRQDAIQRHMNRFTATQLESCIGHAARIDRMIKGLITGDVWDELLKLGLKLAPGKASTSGKRR